MQLLRSLLAPGKGVVCESGIRSNENMSSTRKPSHKLDSAFYRYVMADHDIVLDKNMVADIAMSAIARARQNMGKGPDSGSGSDGACFADCLRMNEVGHLSFRSKRAHASTALALFRIFDLSKG